MASGNNTGGTVTPADGAHAASLALLGQYMASSFVTAGDGHGGTPIADPPSSRSSRCWRSRTPERDVAPESAMSTETDSARPADPGSKPS